MLSITFFIGCKDQEGGENVALEQFLATEEIVVESESESVMEVIEAKSGTSSSIVSSDEGMNPEDINIEYLYNNWVRVLYSKDGKEIVDPSLHLRRYKRNGVANYHSIEPYGGTYEFLQNYKWTINGNLLTITKENGITVILLIINLTENELSLKHVSIDSKNVEYDIIRVYEVYTEEYDFDGDYILPKDY